MTRTEKRLKAIFKRTEKLGSDVFDMNPFTGRDAVLGALNSVRAYLAVAIEIEHDAPAPHARRK